MLEAGYDGTELRLRTRARQRSVVRCKPGTFEWRYSVGEHDNVRESLYQAGVKFASIVERAGMDGPGTVDWGKVGSTQWRDLPMPRLLALDAWKHLAQDLGKLVTSRLIGYVVEGKTTAQLARKYRVSPKMMAVQLNSDLAMAAVHFGYAPRGR